MARARSMPESARVCAPRPCLGGAMQKGLRALTISVLFAGASLAIHADATPQSQAGEIQLQLGNEFFAEGRYQRALTASVPADPREARAGIVQAALRVADFDLARVQADALVKSAPLDPGTLALGADALWASGLFEEAEAGYRDALSTTPDLARGHHGLARALAARSRLDEAMNEAQEALRLSPRDLEVHHTIGAIYERMHKFEEAAGAY